MKLNILQWVSVFLLICTDGIMGFTGLTAIEKLQRIQDILGPPAGSPSIQAPASPSTLTRAGSINIPSIPLEYGAPPSSPIPPFANLPPRPTRQPQKVATRRPLSSIPQRALPIHGSVPLMPNAAGGASPTVGLGGTFQGQPQIQNLPPSSYPPQPLPSVSPYPPQPMPAQRGYFSGLTNAFSGLNPLPYLGYWRGGGQQAGGNRGYLGLTEQQQLALVQKMIQDQREEQRKIQQAQQQAMR